MIPNLLTDCLALLQINHKNYGKTYASHVHDISDFYSQYSLQAQGIRHKARTITVQIFT